MAADLRERVARALAYQAWKDETFWEMYLPESDAVLAELGLTQAEPVGVVEKVIEEMLLCAPSCEPDWDGQLRAWAAMLAAAQQPQGALLSELATGELR